MKTIEEYMALPYRLEIIPDPDEGGFVGAYPDLPGCLTSGETMEEVAKTLRMQNAHGSARHWRKASQSMNRICSMPIPDSSNSASPSPCIVRWPSIPKAKESA